MPLLLESALPLPAAHDRTSPPLWLRITGVGALALLAASPFFAHLIAGLIEKSGKPPRMPLAATVALQSLQSLLLILLAAWGGGKFAPRLGLDAPVLRGAARLSRVPQAALAGTLATFAMMGAEQLFKPFLPAALSQASGSLGGPLLGFSASFYGGVVEEILLRWGLLSLFAFLLVKARLPRGSALVAANLLAALLFGAGHLPAVRALGVPFTAPLIADIVIVNAIGGLVFGWLFIRRGLESAMVGHFTADLWLHVVFAAL